MDILLASILGGVGFLISQNDKNQTKKKKQYEMKNENRIYDVQKKEFNLVNKNFKDALEDKNKVIPRYYNQQVFTKSTKSKLTGEIIENFSHNNMTPFFGGSIKQNMSDKSNETILEVHTGQPKFKYEKNATEPFYNPTPDSNVYGTQNVTDELVNRFVVGNKRRNEHPIEKQIVGPGLNDGYTTLPSGGFQQADARDYVLPKNIDELRPLSDPKISFGGRIITGKHVTDKPSVVGNVNKYRPTREFKHGHERLFTSVGTEVKPKSIPTIVMKDTNRKDTHTSYAGIAGYETKKQKSGENYKISTKQNYLTDGYRNLHANDKWNSNLDFNNYGKTGIDIQDNERTNILEKNHASNVTNVVKALIAPIQDLFRTTRKENFIGNNRESGNFNPVQPKQYVYDPNNIARTTVKETTIHNNHTGNIDVVEKGIVKDPNDVARTTTKETTIHNNHTGNVDVIDKGIVYDPNDVARTTIKETTIHNNHTGNIDVVEKGVIKDPNDVARTTTKETTIHNNRTGNLKSYSHVKHTVIDPKALVAKITIRQTTETNKRSSNVTGPTKLFVYNPNDVTRTTIKETTLDNKRTGNYSNSEALKGGYLVNVKEAPNTNRQFTSKEYTGIMNNDRTGGDGYLVANTEVGNTNRQFTSTEYGGSAGSVHSKAMSYFDKYNMEHDNGKESTLEGREPTTSNVSLANGKDSVHIESHKVSQNEITRDNQQGKIFNLPQNLSTCNITKDKNKVDDSSIIERIDPSTLNAFNKNPFTKSLHSYHY